MFLATNVPVHAADDCSPVTQQCIDTHFRTFYAQGGHGGLPLFGMPITAARDEVNADTGHIYLTQWFERNRFESHPENAAPYTVLLGRLGAERLQQLGRNWQTEPRASGPQDRCLWFPQTKHNVCDYDTSVQGAQAGFKSYWQAEGLVDPGLDVYNRSLALHGLPLTDARMETNGSGDTVLTQWFERDRLEWHPTNPVGFRVQLGLLGSELRSSSKLHLGRGSRGPQVTELQQRLDVWLATTHYSPSPLPITGFFGPQTEVVVRSFQLNHGLPVTGEVDDATWAKLPALP